MSPVEPVKGEHPPDGLGGDRQPKLVPLAVARWWARAAAGRALVITQIPVALVAGSPDEPHTDVVDADNRTGTQALVRHLLEQHGRTRFFCVAGPPEAPDARERRLVLTETLAGYQGVRLDGCFESRFAAISGQLAVREILAAPRRERPDAIVCGNDQMAIGAIRELHTAGFRVPADVAVVGFDDMHIGALVAPLTTVRQPMRLIGERACSCLLDRIADPTRPRRVARLPTTLIIRESCGCADRRSPHPPEPHVALITLSTLASASAVRSASGSL
jgi:LacI family transcriptional regulator